MYKFCHEIIQFVTKNSDGVITLQVYLIHDVCVSFLEATSGNNAYGFPKNFLEESDNHDQIPVTKNIVYAQTCH